MGHAKDVDSYPEIFLQLSAAMRTQKRIELGPMTRHNADKMRGKWYGFVRAHYHTIARDIKLMAQARAQPQLVANIAVLNDARQMRLDVIKKFEVQLIPDADDIDIARLIFIEKSLAYGNVADQIGAIFAALPEHQRRTEEEMQLQLQDIKPGPITRTKAVEPRNDPALAEFFKPLSIDERIRMGAASEADFLEALKTSEFDSLAAQVNAFSSSAVDSATQELLRAEMLAALLSARAQLDSPGERGYPAQDLGGRDATSEIDLTEFIPQTGDPVQ